MDGSSAPSRARATRARRRELRAAHTDLREACRPCSRWKIRKAGTSRRELGSSARRGASPALLGAPGCSRTLAEPSSGFLRGTGRRRSRAARTRAPGLQLRARRGGRRMLDNPIQPHRSPFSRHGEIVSEITIDQRRAWYRHHDHHHIIIISSSRHNTSRWTASRGQGHAARRLREKPSLRRGRGRAAKFRGFLGFRPSRPEERMGEKSPVRLARFGRGQSRRTGSQVYALLHPHSGGERAMKGLRMGGYETSAARAAAAVPPA
jgi:hypothetical protein